MGVMNVFALYLRRSVLWVGLATTAVGSASPAAFASSPCPNLGSSLLAKHNEHKLLIESHVSQLRNLERLETSCNEKGFATSRTAAELAKGDAFIAHGEISGLHGQIKANAENCENTFREMEKVQLNLLNAYDDSKWGLDKVLFLMKGSNLLPHFCRAETQATVQLATKYLETQKKMIDGIIKNRREQKDYKTLAATSSGVSNIAEAFKKSGGVIESQSALDFTANSSAASGLSGGSALGREKKKPSTISGEIGSKTLVTGDLRDGVRQQQKNSAEEASIASPPGDQIQPASLSRENLGSLNRQELLESSSSRNKEDKCSGTSASAVHCALSMAYGGESTNESATIVIAEKLTSRTSLSEEKRQPANPAAVDQTSQNEALEVAEAQLSLFVRVKAAYRRFNGKLQM